MSLLPPKFQDPLLKTLGPPIRKEQENKPVEVYIGNGVWRVNGRLETRIKLEEDQVPIPVVIEHDVDIPLPEFKVGGMVQTIDHGPFYGIPIGSIGIIVGVSVSGTLEILFLGEKVTQQYTPDVWERKVIVRYETR